MSEIRANKIAALGADIQFWTGAPTEKLRIDAAGNLCFGDVGALGAHIPPPEGIAPMYSARAWGRIVTSTDISSGLPVINYTLSKTKNIDMTPSPGNVVTKWINQARIEVGFLTPLPSAYYTVVASCNLSASSPLLVARASTASPATTTGLGLTVYNANNTSGTGFSPNATAAYPELIEFIVFA